MPAPLTIDDVRAMVLALPGTEEVDWRGTPGFKVRGRFLCRLKEDGETLGIRITFDEREMLMEADPEAFFLTDHYRPYPAVLVRLSKVDPGTLNRLIVQHWRKVAPKKLVKTFDEAGGQTTS